MLFSTRIVITIAVGTGISAIDIIKVTWGSDVMVLVSTYGRIGVALSLLNQRFFMHRIDSIDLTRSV